MSPKGPAAAPFAPIAQSENENNSHWSDENGNRLRTVFSVGGRGPPNSARRGLDGRPTSAQDFPLKRNRRPPYDFAYCFLQNMRTMRTERVLRGGQPNGRVRWFVGDYGMKRSVNEAGRRIGEGHPRARHSDAMVEQILRCNENGLSSISISLVLGIPASTIRSILSGKARRQEPSVWQRKRRKRVVW